MTTNEQPVKPAMTDEEIEVIIAEYLARKMGPVMQRANAYCKIDASFTSIPEFSPRFEFLIYAEATGCTTSPSASLAVEFTLAALGDVKTAKRLREEAAAKIARAEQIEAAASQGGAE